LSPFDQIFGLLRWGALILALVYAVRIVKGLLL